MSQTILKKMQCPRCFQNGGDKSKDNLVVYLNEDKSESAHCFVCLYTIPSLDYKKKYGTHIPKEIIFPVNKYTQDDWLKDLPNYNTNPKNFRGLKKSTCAKYRVRHEYDEETGEVAVQFYPVTKDYEFSGIKKRIALPEKDFRALGTVSKHCDLFGENIFKDAHLSQGKVKTVVLTSGELDALTVYQMLDDNRQELNARNNTDYATVPVLSGVVGEAGNINQYRLKYDFLNRYDRIVYIPDQDEAGEDALHRLASALPRDKLFVVHLPSGCKDPTYMLEQGKEKDFIKAYWNPSAYNPAGVVGSSSLLDRMQEDLMTEKVPLPPFMYEFQNMLAGGFKVESIINIGAACVDSKTEFFSQYGWKSISDYREGDQVMQYCNDTATYSFVTPINYIKEEYNEPFYHIKSNNSKLSMMLTPEHNVAIQSSNSIHPIKSLYKLSTLEVIESLEKDHVLAIPLGGTNAKTLISKKTSTVTKVLEHDGFKYCFTVPSGFLYVRRNGQTFITGNSGAGKSTLVNEMIYHWIYHSPYKIGIISLELSAPQYGVALGSRHLGRKLSLFEKGEEAVAFINLPENREKLIDLYQTETGLDRFHLVDERDGGLDAIKKLVEKLIISCDCRVIILDPLQDVMAGLGNPEQEEFLAWMKSMIKRYSIIFININHVRKSGNGSEANSAGAMITEEDFAGSSTIFKSASVNLLFTRNKYLANDNPYRNIIHSYCSKNRNTGLGGDCGDYYYDNNTHTLHALDVYRAQHPEAFDAWDAKEALENDKKIDEAKVKYNKSTTY